MERGDRKRKEEERGGRMGVSVRRKKVGKRKRDEEEDRVRHRMDR